MQPNNNDHTAGNGGNNN